MNRQNKEYLYDEIVNILSLENQGLARKEIAQKTGRTEGAIHVLLSTWNHYQKEGKAATLSGPWKRHFDRYLSKNNQVAKNIREEVKQESEQKAQPAASSETERLLQSVEANWKKTLESIATLVEYEAKRRAKEETAHMQEELSNLREFKQKAQDSNIAGTLRKSLMSFK